MDFLKQYYIDGKAQDLTQAKRVGLVQSRPRHHFIEN
jgi:hypothetical protein